MNQLTLQLEDLTCPSCIAKIEAATKKLDGVDAATVNILFNASKVKLNYDPAVTDDTTIRGAIEALGYDVRSAKVKPA